MTWWQWLLAGASGLAGLLFVVRTGRDRTGPHDISRNTTTNYAAADSMNNPLRHTGSFGP
jgi:hypothetical protein